MARVWNFIGSFGSLGSSNGQFQPASSPSVASPRGIAVDANYIYVADVGNHRIQIFDRLSYAYVAQFGSLGSGNGHLNRPLAVCVDSNYIYVLDSVNQRIQKFNITTYAYVSQVSVGATVFDMCLSGGLLYVCFSTGINVYSADILILVHTYIDAHIHNPTFISADTNLLYVTDFINAGQNSILVFNKLAYSSPFVTSFNPVASGILIQGNTVDINSIYVVDSDENKIKLFDISTKVYTEFFGSGGGGNGQFNIPVYAFFDKLTTQVFISDGGNNRIQVFNWDFLSVPADPSNLQLNKFSDNSIQLSWQDNS